MSEDDWDAVVRVHLRGHFALLKHAAAHWREQAGEDRDGLDEQRAFLAVSSYSATKGTIGQANYCAAKAGILGMVRSTARELHRYNVRVNAIMPNAYTRMVEAIPGDLRPDEEELPHPEDVAPSVAFLLSDHAEDVTGCSFWVTGDEFGVVTNPELRRVGVDEDGWTAEGLADRFEDTIATGMDLTNVEASRDRDE